MVDEYYNGNGIWIPIEVLHNSELTSTEKILYAEIYYLDRPDIHCTASNEYLAKFLNMSVAGVKKCISHLKELGYIYTASFDGRSRSLATSVKWRNEKDTGVDSRRIPEYPAEGYKNEFLLYRENKIENNIEKAPAEPTLSSSTKSRKRDLISRSKTILVDDLESGKDIAEQKKAKKKSPKELFRDECLEIIEHEYSDSSADLLTDYFNFVSDVKQADSDNKMKVVKTVSAWRKKLDKLEELVKEGYDCEKLIKQSLENKKYVFYPLESVDKNTQYNNQSNKFETCDVFPTMMTHEEILAEKQRLIDAGAKIY